MNPSNSRSRRKLPFWLGCAAVAAGCCLPLFMGLDRWDLQNDEAIYAYAVDRMIDGAGWATPRSSPTDGPFLEKPPLKFWMVAVPIDAGLLPHDEFGLRFMDALLGSVALLYVYGLGVWLAGPVCGIVAALVLFLFGPLLFEHGLRSNNMEAPLLLCQTAGLYHFARWVEAEEVSKGRAHAFAVAGYFALGFMTKFVAALFLPFVAVAALACRRDAWRRLSDRWREWVAPSLVVLVIVVPWFAYQTQQFSGLVWRVMLGQHVYTRFTASLDPQHMEPWSFYLLETWRHLHEAGTLWLVLVGVAVLAAAAARGDSWRPRLVLAWALLPVVVLSLGTSKLYHYIYPFLPPLGLAAGYAAAVWVRTFTRVARHTLAELFPAPRAAMSIAGGYAAAIALVPLFVLLPVPSYRQTVAETQSVASPLRAIRDCGLALRASRTAVGSGFYNAASQRIYHSYFYYLRRLGPRRDARHPEPAEIRRRLSVDGQQTPVVVSQEDYNALAREASTDVPSAEGGIAPRPAAAAIAVGDGLIVMLPGAYESCVQPAVAAGATQAADTGGAS